MQLGFVTAILPDLTLEEVLAFASDEGFACVEVMCWPPADRPGSPAGREDGRHPLWAERRYAGVTHIDVTNFGDDEAGRIKDLTRKYGVSISALGYYPNFLDPDRSGQQVTVDHYKKVISATAKLGLNTSTTFIGRDWTKSDRDNWPLAKKIWPDILRHAEANNVRIAIENCPMLFSYDEWPGGKNLAMSPATWRQMFEQLPSPNLGINFDPSHLVWLHIDCRRAIKEFGNRIFHAHAKDTKIDPDKLYEVGVMGLGWNTPKIPGYGDVPWGPYFSALSDAGYQGPVCIEVEDRAFEDSLDSRKLSLRQSKKFLEQFLTR